MSFYPQRRHSLALAWLSLLTLGIVTACGSADVVNGHGESLGDDAGRLQASHDAGANPKEDAGRAQQSDWVDTPCHGGLTFITGYGWNPTMGLDPAKKVDGFVVYEAFAGGAWNELARSGELHGLDLKNLADATAAHAPPKSLFLITVTADKPEACASAEALHEFLGPTDTAAEALLRLGFDGIEIGCNDPAAVESQWARSWTRQSDDGFDVRVDEAGCAEGIRREFHVAAAGTVTMVGEQKLTDFITVCSTPN